MGGEFSFSGSTCRSIWGFQSLSYSTTTSAVYRLMPRPPARVDSRKMNFSLPALLYSSIWLSLSSPLVLPAHPWCHDDDCRVHDGRVPVRDSEC